MHFCILIFKTMTMTHRFELIRLVVLLLLASANAHATIRRVNNAPGSSATYTTAYAAVAAANTGDTLHIEGSVTSYTDLLLNKRLVVIGPGYFLNETNANPNTQFNKNSAVVINVNFQPGSKGSVVMGLDIRNSLTVSDSFVTLQRNIINNVGITLASSGHAFGDTIRNNYFTGASQIIHNSGTYKAYGLMVYNNIFAINYNAINITTLSAVSGFFINNSFLSVDPVNFNCSNFTFQNNIFNKANFGLVGPSNIFLRNIAFSGIPVSGGNSVGINMDDVYLGWSAAGTYSSDGRFKLKAASPAIGFGMLAGAPVDCGAFGGPAPYVLSGMAPVPSIYDLSIPETVTSGTATINISVSATSEH